MNPEISQVSPDAALPWFAVYVKTHHEKCIAKALRGKGYASFLPLYRARHRRSGGFQDVDLPLFPNYLFCRLQPEKRLPILQTPGVFLILGTSQGPEPIPNTEIEMIQKVVRSGCDTRPWPFIRIGDRVSIVEGPLRGCEGITEACKGECWLIVSISLLQRSVAVAIDRRWVRPRSLAASVA